ncbi:MAG: hypothetical protein H0A75_08940 [Candidatus Methanofishera endochildressiae]|uniref:Uncharacterized protein n=1 Tax=Candidatus Methanofishera endochildressiae TaxID=2738884 RepID=A0A7Z0MQQ1_9GAMM|nr:hypothetical protein [Candidatus Methanofishera endochildressiae]
MMLISIACYVLALDGLSVFDGVLMFGPRGLFFGCTEAMAEQKSDILKKGQKRVPEKTPKKGVDFCWACWVY